MTQELEMNRSTINLHNDVKQNQKQGNLVENEFWPQSSGSYIFKKGSKDKS